MNSNSVCYISGPITGINGGNKAQFRVVTNIYRDLGSTVINPHELDIGVDVSNWGWCRYMCRDLKHVCDSDYIILLEDWQQSCGAVFEALLGCVLGKRVISHKTRRSVKFWRAFFAFSLLALSGRFDNI